MIEEICIKNFKSFGPATKPITLQPVNFVVGANASGKTNLLSALRFLKLALLQSVEVATNEYGGPGEVRNKITRERDTPKPLHLGLSMSPYRRRRSRNPSGKIYFVRRYHYEVDIDLRSENTPAIVSESLSAEITVVSDSERLFTMKRNRNEVTIDDPITQRSRGDTFPVEESDESRLVASSTFISPIFADFRRNIQSWAFFNINPESVREASKDVIDPELGEAGEFLATVLHRMEKERDDSLPNLINSLRGAIPAFKGVRSRQLEVEGKRTFQIIEQRLRAGINPRAASDGSIRLLALMVIVYWSAQRKSLVCIEEPETGLHPHLAGDIIEVLRTAAQTSQVLATTHNPDFLDELEPQEVILCDKVNGITEVRHAADIAEIQSFRRHFRLGELWEQGTLGGIP